MIFRNPPTPFPFQLGAQRGTSMPFIGSLFFPEPKCQQSTTACKSLTRGWKNMRKDPLSQQRFTWWKFVILLWFPGFLEIKNSLGFNREFLMIKHDHESLIKYLFSKVSARVEFYKIRRRLEETIPANHNFHKHANSICDKSPQMIGC